MKPIDCTTPEGRTALVKRLARKYPFDPEWDFDVCYLRNNPRGALVKECRQRLRERGIQYERYLKVQPRGWLDSALNSPQDRQRRQCSNVLELTL